MQSQVAQMRGFPPIEARGLIKDVSLRKDETIRILHGVDFQADWGRMTGIVGPSGSGKSTLLYSLAGLESISGGQVTVLGERIDRMGRAKMARFRRAHLGFVFQSYNLVPTLNVEENIALPFLLRGRRAPKGEIAAMLERFGMADRRRSDIGSLSGGEQQRVALARVLVSKPDVVFADEPTGALDQATGRVVIDELHRVAADPARAVVVVTHSEEVASSCDRVVTLVDGRITGGAR
ncbi:putative ABC transporter ATP-binding component [Bifidobacterium actinocoloniiforme DSM 22766]|uniref:Putative ABC transporter ATP-binding component n=1 Tax=Bifidobacterium actinocoloniiforme DSM 22766 TaxID=1437605 RepID=A0A086Z1R6_9BIFI|nr:ABC transporter ATP-binding protein [Bifidobacterium actinocoloniiforme]KFI40466.1 putative ABC transporter ATP-binding component [Bifidobacterium actinocoloniiforme DSM 22766]